MTDILTQIPWPVLFGVFLVLLGIVTTCLVTGFRLQWGDKLYELTPTWRKDFSDWRARHAARTYINSNPSIPNHYDHQYLHSRLILDYGPGIQYLVVQYGSSVRGHSNPNDEDYLVILTNYEHEMSKQMLGHERKPSGLYAKALDVEVRNILSFIVGMLMGKPYEISVVNDGKVKGSHNCEPELFDWLKVLSNRLVVEPQYIISQLAFDQSGAQSLYDEESKNGNVTYRQIAAAYHNACCYAQIRLLSKISDKYIPAKLVYPLSQVSTLIRSVNSPDAKQSFEYIANCFKRNIIPPNRAEYEKHVRTVEREYGVNHV